MSLHEECGVFGVISPQAADVAGIMACMPCSTGGRKAAGW